MAPKRASPDAGLIPNVTGTNNATPIVLVSPGSAPIITPKTVPANISSRIAGSARAAMPASILEKICSITSYLPELKENAFRQTQAKEGDK